MRIRAIIADDEPLARASVRALLQGESDIEIVADASDGRSTVRAVKHYTPDLLFLDIVMPYGNGFDVLAALATHHIPVVILMSASEQFALRSSVFHGADCLRKPITRARFVAALNAARAALRGSVTSANPTD